MSNVSIVGGSGSHKSAKKNCPLDECLATLKRCFNPCSANAEMSTPVTECPCLSRDSAFFPSPQPASRTRHEGGNSAIRFTNLPGSSPQRTFLTRISQTYLCGLSNWADELRPWRRLGGVGTVRTRVDRMTGVLNKMSRHKRGHGHAETGRVAAQPGLDGGQLGSAIVGRRVPDRHRQARTRSARESPRPWRT